MDHDVLTGALKQHILEDAKSRSDAVRRGAETRKLAALLLHKFESPRVLRRLLLLRECEP